MKSQRVVTNRSGQRFSWMHNIHRAESKFPNEIVLFYKWRDQVVTSKNREPSAADFLEMIESSKAPEKQMLAKFFLTLVKRRRLQKKLKN